MTIDIKKKGEEITIAVVGRLDILTSPVFDKAVNEDAADASGIIIDMKELEDISSEGLRVLLGAHKKCRKQIFLDLQM